MGLALNMKPLDRLTGEISVEDLSKGMGSKKKTEKILKDITNKLEAEPVKLKSEWAASKLGATHRIKIQLHIKGPL